MGTTRFGRRRNDRGLPILGTFSLVPQPGPSLLRREPVRSAPMSTGPRISPLPEAERTDADRELLEQASAPGSAASNIFTTLVRHRRLFRRWLPFGGVLLTGAIPARDRELLILRTGWLCRSPYEWGQHAVIGRAVGLSDAEVARIATGPDADGWEPWDALLLRAADELHESHTISDETWAALAEIYDTKQLVEVPMVVGHYHLVAMTLNTLGVEREPGVEGLPG